MYGLEKKLKNEQVSFFLSKYSSIYDVLGNNINPIYTIFVGYFLNNKSKNLITFQDIEDTSFLIHTTSYLIRQLVVI